MKDEKGSREGRYHHGNLKRALIDAAVSIINRRGKRGLTLRSVAAAAHVSRSAPYRHFKNKDAILAGVAEEGFVELTRRLSAIASSEKDFLDRIIGQAHAYVKFAGENPAHFEVMFGFNLQSYFLYPSLLDTAASAASCLFETVEKCQAAGIIQEGDQTENAFGAWMLIHGFAMLYINGLVPFDVQEEGALKKVVGHYAMSYLEGMRNMDKSLEEFGK